MPVVEERVQCSTVRRRDGHSCYSRKNRSEERKQWNPWKIIGERKRGKEKRYRPGSRRRFYEPRLPTGTALEKIPFARTAEWRDYGVGDDDVGHLFQATGSGMSTSWEDYRDENAPAKVNF